MLCASFAKNSPVVSLFCVTLLMFLKYLWILPCSNERFEYSERYQQVKQIQQSGCTPKCLYQIRCFDCESTSKSRLIMFGISWLSNRLWLCKSFSKFAESENTIDLTHIVSVIYCVHSISLLFMIVNWISLRYFVGQYKQSPRITLGFFCFLECCRLNILFVTHETECWWK